MRLEIAQKFRVFPTEVTSDHDFVNSVALELSLSCHDSVVVLQVLGCFEPVVDEDDVAFPLPCLGVLIYIVQHIY